MLRSELPGAISWRHAVSALARSWVRTMRSSTRRPLRRLTIEARELRQGKGRGQTRPGTSPTIPGPADSVQRNAVDLDEEAH
jgi:hypothetical protein